MKKNTVHYKIIILLCVSAVILPAAAACYSKNLSQENQSLILPEKKPEGWHTKISFPHKEPDPHRLAKEQNNVRSLMASHYEQGLFSSFAVAVFTSEKILFTHYINSSPQMVYSTGSVTKLITATLFQMMTERKNIIPEMMISEYYPDLAYLWKDYHSVPDLNQFISHTSGLPDLRYYPQNSSVRVESLNLNIVPPVYPPGVHYRYSNQGYIIIGNVIEKACGKKIDQCAKEELFIPLGMNKSEGPANGAGGFTTSIHDLIQFGRMYLNKGNLNGRHILKPSSIEEMMHPGFYIPPARSSFFTGRGWRVKRDSEGVVTIFHIGGANYVSAWLQLFPPYDIGIAYLGNPPEYSDEVMGYLIRMQYALGSLAGAYVSSEKPVYHWTPDFPDENLWQQYPGNYRNEKTGETLTIRTRDKQLILNHRGSYILNPETHQLYTGGPGLSYQFVVEPSRNKVIAVANAHGYFIKTSDQ